MSFSSGYRVSSLMMKTIKRIMVVIVLIIVRVLVIAPLMYMQQAKFGKSPSGERFKTLKLK